eukprot:TRINITY_DN73486_c0_g1_i1.p1 TRINITY_DN73486_c0_g1~~TRINITY_DN73486_c0_g1_i1.p1  ORF type:complete len:571 (-),score=99.33 TRINITY_DN73486_c0_g1_i1:268-1959(-)
MEQPVLPGYHPMHELQLCIERHRQQLEDIWLRSLLPPDIRSFTHEMIKELSVVEDQPGLPIAGEGGHMTTEASEVEDEEAPMSTEVFVDAGHFLEQASTAAEEQQSQPTTRVGGNVTFGGDCQVQAGANEDERAAEMCDLSAQASTSNDKGVSDGGDSGKESEDFVHKMATLSLAQSRVRQTLIGEAVTYQDNIWGRLVSRQTFDNVSALMIVASCALVGLDIELQNSSNKVGFEVAQYLLLAYFTFELAARILARGRMFLAGLDWKWNIFDLGCVSTSYLEIALRLLQGENVVFNSRMVRMVRITRIIRVVRASASLRMMVFTILGAMRLLLWAVLSLLLVMYTFAVSFTEGYKTVADPGERQKLSKFFGSLGKSMLTLFQVVTGGLTWNDVYEPLEEINQLLAATFLAYICLVVFTVLNVITGVCCEQAIVASKNSKEDAIRARLRGKEQLIKDFCEIFKCIDDDGSGDVSAVEFEKQLEDEAFQAYLCHLDVTVDDAVEMFEALDTDKSGSISASEFVTGCMKLKGEARTIDVVRLDREIQSVKKMISGQTAPARTTKTM